MLFEIICLMIFGGAILFTILAVIQEIKENFRIGGVTLKSILKSIFNSVIIVVVVGVLLYIFWKVFI